MRVLAVEAAHPWEVFIEQDRGACGAKPGGPGVQVLDQQARMRLAGRAEVLFRAEVQLDAMAAEPAAAAGCKHWLNSSSSRAYVRYRPTGTALGCVTEASDLLIAIRGFALAEQQVIRFALDHLAGETASPGGGQGHRKVAGDLHVLRVAGTGAQSGILRLPHASIMAREAHGWP